MLEAEPDAGLGAGGVGSAAAAFLDALVAAGIAQCAYGINYQFGPFQQRIRQGQQVEAPGHWRRHGSPWLVERAEPALRIPFGGSVEAAKDSYGAYRPQWADHRTVLGVPYDMFISGPGGRSAGVLRLFCARASDEFDRPIDEFGDYTKAIEEKAEIELLTKVLYTQDGWTSPSRFRLLQEYFLVACALRDILRSSGIENLDRLPERAVVHPERHAIRPGGGRVDAVAIGRNPAAMGGGLGDHHAHADVHDARYDGGDVRQVARLDGGGVSAPPPTDHLRNQPAIPARSIPRLAGRPQRVRRMSLIEENLDKQLRVAHLAVAGCHSVTSNGSPHFDLLRTELLPDFVLLWPGKFNAKTAGVNVRRWIRVANPDLAELITQAVGEGWESHPERLKKLESFSGDAAFRERFLTVKRENKRRLQRVLRIPFDEPRSLLSTSSR